MTDSFQLPTFTLSFTLAELLQIQEALVEQCHALDRVFAQLPAELLTRPLTGREGLLATKRENLRAVTDRMEQAVDAAFGQEKRQRQQPQG